MFYYIPVWAFPMQVPQHSDSVPGSPKPPQAPPQEIDEPEHLGSAQNFQISSEVWEAYLKIFEEELRILLERQQKKVWSKEEDAILLAVKDEEADWGEISGLIPGTNAEICRRRYNRMKHTNKKWPKEVDQQIINLYEEKRSKWSAIASIINEKFNYRYKYTGKMIKERYQFYLRDGICNNEWTVQEDIRLLREIRNNGRFWKNMLHKFEGRTELQLKNRFNGTLRLVQKRVVSKLKQLTQHPQ